MPFPFSPQVLSCSRSSQSTEKLRTNPRQRWFSQKYALCLLKPNLNNPYRSHRPLQDRLRTGPLLLSPIRPTSWKHKSLRYSASSNVKTMARRQYTSTRLQLQSPHWSPHKDTRRQLHLPPQPQLALRTLPWLTPRQRPDQLMTSTRPETFSSFF